jgi:hypothetical protein
MLSAQILLSWVCVGPFKSRIPWKEEKAMIKVAWKLIVLGMFIPVLILQGCSIESDEGDVIVIDDMSPAEPRGVYSITGDTQVVIGWYPNQETDLDGYRIYSSLEESGKYVEIAEVGRNISSYIDNDVENGVTYFYAVSAFDVNGNESKLSPVIEDTPRPEGRNITLDDYLLRPDSSGFDFSNPRRGAQPYKASGVDIYFGVGTVIVYTEDGEEQLSVPYIYSVSDDIRIQDLGYTDDMDEIDVSPVEGFTFAFVEAIIGHTYTFQTLDGNYAKIRITDLQIEWVGDEIQDAWVTFDWAYQLQIDNPELAPGKNHITRKEG